MDSGPKRPNRATQGARKFMPHGKGRGLQADLSHLPNAFRPVATQEATNATAVVLCSEISAYLLEEGFEDREIRRKLAKAYWMFAPSLRYCAPFLEDNNDEKAAFHRTSDRPATSFLAPGLGPSTSSLAPPSSHGIQSGWDQGRVVAASLIDSTGTESASNALNHISLPPPVVPEMSKVTLASESYSNGANLSSTDEIGAGVGRPCRQRRLRVGFLSAFFFHHSVGLLTEGVVTRLDRLRFETTAIFLQPHPKSTKASKNINRNNNGSGGGEQDRVYERVRRETEHVLDIPMSSPAACHHAIASLKLDVLVFTEIGMNPESYFLSFARLARRSALFWGHAVTSGVSAFESMSTLSLRVSGKVAKKPDESFADLRKAGGVDYFVSSWLFEDSELGRLAQRKYSERLYLMNGITTRFARPPPPEPNVVTRNSLGIPPIPNPTRSPGKSSACRPLSTEFATGFGDDGRGATTYGGAKECGALYVVPQTLYKFHPDFDRLVAGILKRDPSGCAVLIQALKPALTEGLTKRMMSTFRAEGVVGLERVIFVRRLGFIEYSGLIALADVVLDPFPVGGGRSSLEIFATGTPIIMFYNRTSILQLTYGMYATMGLEGNLAAADNSNPPVSLVTYSEHQFIISAVAVATDGQLNARTRERILARNHRLYEQDSAVAEWEEFLEGISISSRPHPAELYNLAVDASNFSGPLAWCLSSTVNPGDGGYIGLEAPDMAGSSAVGTSGAGSSSGSTQGNSEGASAKAALRKEASSKEVHKEILSKYRTRPYMSPSDNDYIQTEANRRRQLLERTAISTESGWSTDTTKFGPGIHETESSAGAAGADDRSRELLYAVELSVEPAYKGGPTKLLTVEATQLRTDVVYHREFTDTEPTVVKVFEGDDPTEKARTLMEMGELDFLQYRWMALVLCRGIGRLSRPVVWSKHVRIDDGPSLLLEVRQGDDLYQVSQWHCRRYSLGGNGIIALSEQLEKVEVRMKGIVTNLPMWACLLRPFPPAFTYDQEIPQHQDSGWIASRAGDRLLLPSAYRSQSHRAEYTSSMSNIWSKPATTMDRRTNPHIEVDERGTLRGVYDSLGRRNIYGPGATKHDYDGCVTLAITTCKRLNEFLGTVDGLQALLGPLPDVGDRLGQDIHEPEGIGASVRVCHVIIVDDDSSLEDRQAMMSAHPEFAYVFKTKYDGKGHAVSMNIILSLTQTRYLLYVEDDWWPVEDEPSQLLSNERSFLWRAMEVLRNSLEDVSQVLINDQSSRGCALGNVTICPQARQGIAGWPRFTPVTKVCNAHNTIANSGGSSPGGSADSLHRRGISTNQSDACEFNRANTANETTSVVDRHDSAGEGGVEYRLHEFGLMYPSHDFSYWPGFSFNPALWDLKRLDEAYRRNHRTELWFDPISTRFEQTMSMELLDAGVTIAHLPDLTFRHVGQERSAYEANGIRRPWDRSP